MKRHTKHDTPVDDITHQFKRYRKKLLQLSLIIVGMMFLSIGIIGTQMFYPFHTVIGLSIYAVSFIPLGRRIYLSRKAWKRYQAYTWTADFFVKEQRRVAWVVCGALAVIAVVWVRPLDDKPFDTLSDESIMQSVADDLYTGVVAMDWLESSGNELLTVVARDKRDVAQTTDITVAFEEFLRAVSFSESYTDVHRYFATIPYRLWDTRIDSFLISYSLYAKKYELMHRIMMQVGSNTYLKKVLNQTSTFAGRDGVFNEMVLRFYEPKTRLRLSGGNIYLRIFAPEPATTETPYALLYGKGRESYGYLKNNFGKTLLHTGNVLVDAVERKMFDSWFPIQKNVATAMGRAILTTRGKDGLITDEQALELAGSMHPGDIMLQRRNWHISNVGIPGFWTHAALYTGTLEEMDTYFKDEFPYRGYASFSDLLRAEHPVAHKTYSTLDERGYPVSVLEAIEPGVVMRSMPESADADFVVVLRPGLSKHDKLLALENAFTHVGKPYDFNFDFDTLDALVCSELVYTAYYERPPSKQGLQLETSIVNGRPIVTPLDIAHKFVNEFGSDSAQLFFVSFLRGNENMGTAHAASQEDFMSSISWSKFSFFQP